MDAASTLRNVLLATDFSAASQVAFLHAIAICKQVHAELHILHVFDDANFAPPESGGLLLEAHAFRHEAEDSVGMLVESACSQGVTCSGGVAGGIASSAILDAIRSTRADVCILGTRGIRGFERLIFGSTAEAVLRHAPCPVWTVGPHAGCCGCRRTTGPVVFATDFHRTTTSAIRLAATFARARQSALHCVHVLPRSLQGESNPLIVPEILKEALQHLARDTEAELQPTVCAIEYSGEISNAVVNYAAGVHAGLIVLGVRRAPLLAAHVPAHIAYRIITEASCPVLTSAFP